MRSIILARGRNLIANPSESAAPHFHLFLPLSERPLLLHFYAPLHRAHFVFLGGGEVSLCFEGGGEESGAIDCLISLASPPPLSLVAIYRKCLFWTPSNVFTACTNASGGGGREGMANTPDKRALLLLLPSLFLLSLHGGGEKGIKRVTLSFSVPAPPLPSRHPRKVESVR